MPAPDFDAMAGSLANRFDSGVATPAAPVGETDVRLSTENAGNDMGPLPCVFVWIESGRVDVQGGQTRISVARGRVRFYLDLATDDGRVEVRLRKWLTVLFARLRADTTLGGTVDRAIISEWRLGVVPFGNERYDGIELLVDMTNSEAWAAS